MLQDFETPSAPENGPPRLALLRAELAREGLAGFIVPRADAHQGEYVPARDARLAWLTGFTGSAGFCCALRERAAVFVDGRYRLQVREQVATSHFEPVDWPETSLTTWLIEALPEGGEIGFDPWLHTGAELAKWERAAAGRWQFRACANLVDRIWADQPAAPAGRIYPWPEELAGESSAAKRARLGVELAQAGQEAAVLTLPDGICWLLNLRGEDLPRVPVALGFALLFADGRVEWFLTPGREIDCGPAAEGLRLRDASEFEGALRALTGKVRLDPAMAPLAVRNLLARPEDGADPCILPKARKNPAEVAGHEVAQQRDGAAMCEFLCWLEREAPGGGLDEIAVVTALEGFRRATGALRDLSFDTICGAGPHGAIPHYRVSIDSSRPLRPGDLVVIDSGGQYLEGTTDITRTVPVGAAEAVGEAEKRAFTRVLQGMIALSRVRFPKGVGGQHLDTLARVPLWQAGQDFDHGTGHGIGAYLSVHEGPQRFSRLNDVVLEPGMMLSNEPGYYRAGAFGVRIENLVLVEEAPPLPEGDAHRQMLRLRTLTFVPIDRRLIVAGMLAPEERAWLDAYHAEVRERLQTRVSPQTREWLHRATAPL